MTKLHIYQKAGNYWSSVADGDGDTSSKAPFQVLITAGSVLKGKT